MIERAGGEFLFDRKFSKRVRILGVGLKGYPLGHPVWQDRARFAAEGLKSNKIVKAERWRAAGHDIAIVPETALYLMATEQMPAGRSLTVDRVAATLGVEARVIEAWHDQKLIWIDPTGLMSFSELVALGQIVGLVKANIPVPTIRKALQGLRPYIPSVDQGLSRLKIVPAAGKEILLVNWEGMLTGRHRQGFLDFYGDTPRGPERERDAIPLSAGVNPRDAGSLFRSASVLEEAGKAEEAAAAYRRVIALEPGRPEPYYNLGNVLRGVGEQSAAMEMFRLATVIEPSHANAWYNLADLQMGAGKYAEALESLDRALRASPFFPDAVFNRAVCLERLGRARDAFEAWKMYVSLDPDGEASHTAMRRVMELRRIIDPAS